MIKLSKSCVGEEEKLAVCRVLDNSYLGMGQEVMLFEQELQKFIDPNINVACVNTGTSALHLAIQACGIGVGDEVIVPAITYVACFQAISATGATAVACDINPDNGVMDPKDAEKRITSKTKALMPMHYAGGYGELEEIYNIATKYGLRVIEDAAHSFGGFYKDKRVGAIGDIICFSFDGIKNITCGEGGAVVSSDKFIINKIKDLRLLAVEKDTEQRYKGNRSWDFDVKEQGWRYHMSNINAAIGREQLKKFDDFAQKRKHFWKMYLTKLSDLKNNYLNFLNLDINCCVPHIFPLNILNNKRDDLKKYLETYNIETGIHYKPNNFLSKYNNLFTQKCVNSHYWWEQAISLPLHCCLAEEDINNITKNIKNFFNLC